MMSEPSCSPHSSEPARDPGPGRRSRRGRSRGIVPLALAAAVTLVLGGASVARAVDVPPLDAHSDLEFSLDGTTWTNAPDLVLGAWGCDLAGGPAVPAPVEAIGGTPGVDPCSMSPGESIDRTYHVRNVAEAGRTGRYEVGVGEFVVSEEAEFEVSSTISGPAGVDARTVTLYGAGTPQAGDSPPRGSAVAALNLAPGQSAKVVDEVSVPRDPQNYAQRQSVTPMIWVSFTDTEDLDGDGDGLPDRDEDQLGTDPADPANSLPDGHVGRDYGPEPFLPTPPPGTELDVDTSTLPPGLRLEDGVLVGTPTRAGTYDITFTVTMPDGGIYTSERRVVIHPGSGGGSVDLPDFVWPIVIIGVIGTIVGIIGPGLGSLAGLLSGSLGGSLGGPLGGSGGSSGSSGSAGSAGSAGSTGSSGSGSVPLGPTSSTAPTTTTPTSTAPTSTTAPTSAAKPTSEAASTAATSAAARPDQRDDDGTGQVAANSSTPREGAPSSEWARANSQVRGSLADTGVGAADLLLWALTAAAAGVTLILLASRRRDRDEDPDTTA